MAKANNKRIEETATTALKAALLRCPLLESNINTNDKTISWDGAVFVYQNSNHTKKDLKGVVPIQIKGTQNNISSDFATFSCSVEDLEIYYHTGGAVFFLVSVEPDSGKSKIFYSSLLVFDLKKILDSLKNQKTHTIKLTQFPEDANEIATIFMRFVVDSQKQISFIGKDIVSLEQLQAKGVDVESLQFTTTGIGLNEFNIGSFITTHDFYLYAKPKGIEIEIPVEKVSNAIFSRTMDGKVSINHKEYYSSYRIIYEKGEPTIRVGKCISLSLSDPLTSGHMQFKPTGTIDDVIKDAEFYIDVVENQEVSFNGVTLPLVSAKDADLDNKKESLRYFKDIKRMLEKLGVTEELECDSLSEKDEINIKNFINATLYDHAIGFPNACEPSIYGSFKIGNLSILIWADKQKDGGYKLGNFFDQHKVFLFEDSDTTHSTPIPASQFILLDDSAFAFASNMDYEAVGNSICSLEHHPFLIDIVTFSLLNVLRGYDKQGKKDVRLLDLADRILKWISGYGETADSRIMMLNHLQIIKRRRPLATSEIVELSKLVGNESAYDIQCGAYLLLGDNDEAQKCFEKMPLAERQDFITYPICHFGHLHLG